MLTLLKVHQTWLFIGDMQSMTSDLISKDPLSEVSKSRLVSGISTSTVEKFSGQNFMRLELGSTQTSTYSKALISPLHFVWKHLAIFLFNIGYVGILKWSWKRITSPPYTRTQRTHAHITHTHTPHTTHTLLVHSRGCNM